jgi:hypothetical protein
MIWRLRLACYWLHVVALTVVLAPVVVLLDAWCTVRRALGPAPEPPKPRLSPEQAARIADEIEHARAQRDRLVLGEIMGYRETTRRDA